MIIPHDDPDLAAICEVARDLAVNDKLNPDGLLAALFHAQQVVETGGSDSEAVAVEIIPAP